MEVNDFKLLGKLSAGDMVALKKQYHKQCLVALYSRTRRQQHVVNQLKESVLQKEAFSEIVGKIAAYKMCTSDCKVLKMPDVKIEYSTRLQELYLPIQDQSVHSTRFKDKLLASIPGLSAHAKGREVLLVFENHIAQVLSESLDRERDCKMKSRKGS